MTGLLLSVSVEMRLSLAKTNPNRDMQPQTCPCIEYLIV